MKHFINGYASTVAIILYFSGFWYLVEYFRFIGLTSVVHTLGLEQYALYSFSVVYELAVFSDPCASLRFFSVGVLLLLFLALPNWRIVLPPANPFRRALGRATLPLLPGVFRYVVVSLVFLIVMFDAAAATGRLHACQAIRSAKSITFFGLAPNAFHDPKYLDETRKEFMTLQDNAKLVEVWHDNEMVYAAARESDCANAPRIVYAIKRENFETTQTITVQ